MSAVVDYTVQKSTFCDALELAEKLRAVDRREILASHHLKPLEAAEAVVTLSDECRTGRANGELVCMFGVKRHTMVSDYGSIWMLGTDLVEKYAVRFLRENQREIEKLSAGFQLLENWCDARNKSTLRWLKWLGFTIEPAQPYGAHGMPFHHFYKEF